MPYNKTVKWSFKNQLGAFRCFIGKPLSHEYPTQCTTEYAYVWVLIYVVGFVGLFFTSALLFKKTNAFWTIVLQSLIAPLSSFVFAIKPIVGEHNYVPLSAFTFISFIVIFCALMLRDKKEPYVDRYSGHSFMLRYGIGKASDFSPGMKDPIV